MDGRIVVIAIATILFGFILGSIPVVNDHLHWNFWLVVPISGVIIGSLIGLLQFASCFKLNLQITKREVWILSVATAFAWIAIDFGIYWTSSVPVRGVQGIPDGQYRLAELLTLTQYFENRLGSSTLSSLYRGSMDLGSVGTTIRYVVDVLGATLGTFLALTALAPTVHFCESCRKYLRTTKQYSVLVGPDRDKDFSEAVERARTLAVESKANDLVDYLESLVPLNQYELLRSKLSVTQNKCDGCGASLFAGQVFQWNGTKWEANEGLQFCSTTLKSGG